MISDQLKRFLEGTGRAFVASADADGQPHLAVGRGVKVPDDHHVAFEDWVCPRTLENVAGNPLVALVVLDPVTEMGFQLSGQVEETRDEGTLDGYLPGEQPGKPQVESRLLVRVTSLMEFCHELHTDQAITLE